MHPITRSVTPPTASSEPSPMPLTYQNRIYRRDLRANPTALYLFGDNERRQGLGGQAREMRGEPNAHGIRTKYAPGMTYPSDFWVEDSLDPNSHLHYCRMLTEDFVKPLIWITKGREVVVPSAGLGTGLARLELYAPKTFEHLNQCLRDLVAEQDLIELGGLMQPKGLF